MRIFGYALAVLLLTGPGAVFAETPKEVADFIREREIEIDRITARYNEGVAEIEPVLVQAESVEIPVQADVLAPPQAEAAQADVQEYTQADTVPEEALEEIQYIVRPAVRQLPFEFEASAEYSNYRYREPSLDVTLEGPMYGVILQGTYRDKEATDRMISMYRLQGRYAFGVMDYSSASGSTTGTNDYVFEIKALAGKDFGSQDFRVTPYAGFGFRRLFDAGAGQTTTIGLLGYDRESRYYYIPIGLDFSFQVGSLFTVNPILEYDFLMRGEQFSDLSTIPGYPNLHNKQNSGFGYTLSVRLSKSMKNVDFFIEPFMRVWNIHESDTAIASGSVYTIAGVEPENNTKEFGSRVGVKF